MTEHEVQPIDIEAARQQMLEPRHGVDYLIDCYAVLKVDRTATDEEIVNASEKVLEKYRKNLVQDEHIQQREAAMRVIFTEMQGLLLDEEQRQDYDAVLSGWQGPKVGSVLELLAVPEAWYQGFNLDKNKIEEQLSESLKNYDPSDINSALGIENEGDKEREVEQERLFVVEDEEDEEDIESLPPADLRKFINILHHAQYEYIEALQLSGIEDAERIIKRLYLGRTEEMKDLLAQQRERLRCYFRAKRMPSETGFGELQNSLSNTPLEGLDEQEDRVIEQLLKDFEEVAEELINLSAREEELHQKSLELSLSVVYRGGANPEKGISDKFMIGIRDKERDAIFWLAQVYNPESGAYENLWPFEPKDTNTLVRAMISEKEKIQAEFIEEGYTVLLVEEKEEFGHAFDIAQVAVSMFMNGKAIIPEVTKV